MKYTSTGAILSPCTKYRYLLSREWEQTEKGTCLFVMLNPSTADASQDDATIRRCVFFASKFGCNRLEVVNLFAYRATNPKDLPVSRREARGPENVKHIEEAVRRASTIIIAWGAHDTRGEHESVLWVLRSTSRRSVWCLGLTKEGAPRHPCRLPNATERVLFGEYPTTSTRQVLALVNGEEWVSAFGQSTFLLSVRAEVLRATRNTGRPPEEWEIRDEKGQVLDEYSEVRSLQPAGPRPRIFLSLKIGSGGSQ